MAYVRTVRENLMEVGAFARPSSYTLEINGREFARGVSCLFTEELRTKDLDGTYSVRARFISTAGSMVPPDAGYVVPNRFRSKR